MTDTPVATPVPALSVENIEVVYHHTVQVLRGLSLAPSRCRQIRIAPTRVGLSAFLFPCLFLRPGGSRCWLSSF